MVSFVIMLLIWVCNQALTIYLSFLIVLPLIYTNTLAGFLNVDPEMLEMAETFRLSRWKKFLYIYRPSFMPFLISSCRVALVCEGKVDEKQLAEELSQILPPNSLHQPISQLSGGMKRRAGIAQAMLNDPKILILDEPTAGLDPKERIRFRNLISELAENRLVLPSTHIVSDVEYIADQILLMKDGSLVHHGTSQQLLAAAPTQVWTCTVPRAQADQLLHQYPVVNLKTLPQGVQLRVLSQTPPTPEAHPAEMTLEDLFLHYFGETAGETDAAL